MVNNYIQDADKELANVMKALGHPARLAIIRKILEKSKCPCGCNPCSCGEKCEGENCKCGCKCGELVDLFPMAQSTVSQHLKELKNAGIINMTSRKGDYTLNHGTLEHGLKLLQNLIGDDVNLTSENREGKIGKNTEETKELEMCRCNKN